MPEEDFEIFLSLLGQLLRLDPKQKAAIADELRDHLEERLLELNEQGVPRKDAVRKALEEFGDAAGLASQFTSLSKHRRRRLLMRATLATSAVAGLVFLAIILFGPSNPDGPPQQVVAQDKEPPQQTPPALPADPDYTMPGKLLEEGAVEFVETPLVDVAAYLADAHKVTIILDEKALSDEGISKDVPLSLTAKAPLYLILNRMLKPLDLAWYYKNEMLFITSEIVEDETLSTKFYQVKHLLDWGLTKEQIIDLIAKETSGPWQIIDGTGGTAMFIGQMLSVQQTFHVHLEVAALLDALKKLDQPILRLEPKEHAKLRQALQKPVSVEFHETPLKDAADFLADMMGVPIVLDRSALEEESVAEDAPITLTLQGKTLETTLELMLDPLELSTVMEDGTILITTNIVMEETLTTVIHDVKDIADSESAFRQLSNAIMTITLGPWQANDGTGGSISTLKPGVMVVTQIEPIHQEVEKLLATLRKFEGNAKIPPSPPQIVTQIYRMSADTAEDLLTTLPEFVAPGTWQDEKNKDATGTIRKIAAGQTFVKYPEGEKGEAPATPPEVKPGEKMMAPKEPDPQYIVVPQAVLIIRQTKEVHREIDNFLQNLLPFGTYSAGVPLNSQFGSQPSGGGFGGL